MQSYDNGMEDKEDLHLFFYLICNIYATKLSHRASSISPIDLAKKWFISTFVATKTLSVTTQLGLRL
jgi:hypothetical protein